MKSAFLFSFLLLTAFAEEPKVFDLQNSPNFNGFRNVVMRKLLFARINDKEKLVYVLGQAPEKDYQVKSSYLRNTTELILEINLLEPEKSRSVAVFKRWGGLFGDDSVPQERGNFYISDDKRLLTSVHKYEYGWKDAGEDEYTYFYKVQKTVVDLSKPYRQSIIFYKEHDIEKEYYKEPKHYGKLIHWSHFYGESRVLVQNGSYLFIRNVSKVFSQTHEDLMNSSIQRPRIYGIDETTNTKRVIVDENFKIYSYPDSQLTNFYGNGWSQILFATRSIPKAYAQVVEAMVNLKDSSAVVTNQKNEYFLKKLIELYFSGIDSSVVLNEILPMMEKGNRELEQTLGTNLTSSFNDKLFLANILISILSNVRIINSQSLENAKKAVLQFLAAGDESDKAISSFKSELAKHDILFGELLTNNNTKPNGLVINIVLNKL